MATDKKKSVGKVVTIPTNEKERVEFLANAIKNINKAYGEGSIMKVGAKDVVPIETIPTGCLTIDEALGVGGLPRGRIIEIYGPESSGKTTVALHAIAEAQRLGGTAAFIDAEHALDPLYAEKLGVNIKELYVSQPDNGEQALDIADMLVRSGSVDIIVIDSVAALTPKAEIDGEMGATTVGMQARLMSQALRRITGAINKSKTIMVFINQMREKVGGYGNPETTAGGKALKFYASVRIDIRKGEPIKVGGEHIGNVTKAKIVKNKLASPFKVAVFDIIFGKGINKSGCIFDIAVSYEIIEKSGSWFGYNGEKLGQGKERSTEYFVKHPEVLEEITAKVYEKIKSSGGLAKSADNDDDGDAGDFSEE